VIIGLGGGRSKADDIIDLSVGFTNIASIGTKLSIDRPLAVIHASSVSDADLAAKNLLNAYTLSESMPTQRSIVNETLTV
jgi:thymidine phosphorylase